MKITILNGDMNPGKSEFQEYLENLNLKLNEDNSCILYNLNKMDLHFCTGCWSCWWKTPGLCAINDDAGKIFESFINSDFVIFASPLIAGFTSSSLKKITDRLIVLLHPYIKIINSECHHLKRYDKYPDIGLLLEKEKDTDNEDIKITGDIYDRFAVNFHSRVRYLKFNDLCSIEEIVYETCNI